MVLLDDDTKSVDRSSEATPTSPGRTGRTDSRRVRTAEVEAHHVEVHIEGDANAPVEIGKMPRLSGRSSSTERPVGSTSTIDRGATCRDLTNTAVTQGRLSGRSVLGPLGSDLDPMHGLRPLTATASNHRPLDEDYVVQEQLGKGGFGTVVAVKRKANGKKYAMKIIEVAQIKDLSRFEVELEISRKLQHPNIVRLHEFYRGGDKQGQYRLVMDLCTGGDLYARIQETVIRNQAEVCGGLNTDEVGKYAVQMLSGLAYLHYYEFVHRDLKPENYMLESLYDGAQLKLIDFGLARQCKKSERMRSRVGTPHYAAPEVYLDKTGYTEKCDIWSLGVTVFVAGCSAYPFQGKDVAEIIRAICTGEYSFREPGWRKQPDGLKDFLSKMLVLDPLKRPGARRLLDHPWMVKVKKKDEGCCSVH